MVYLQTASILKVLMIIDGECSSVDICSAPLKHLRDQEKICFESKNITEISLNDILFFDVFYFLRSSDPLNHYWFDIIKRFHKKVVYEVDDNFFALQQECFKRYYDQPLIKSTVANFLRNSDIVKYGSQTLLDELDMGGNSVVLPYPAPMVPKRDARNNYEKEYIKIVFASSKERRDDLLFMIPAIKTILDEFSNVQFHFMGFDEVGGLKGNRVIFHDYIFDTKQFHAYKFDMGANIGLAPLSDSLSNRCKTNNKYREYAAHGIAGIYSKLPPYENVENEKTGLVIENDNEQWYLAMKKLITDCDLRNEIIVNAATDTAKNYSLEGISEKLVSQVLKPLCVSEVSQKTVEEEIRTLRDLDISIPVCKETLKTALKNMLNKLMPRKLYEKLRLIYLYRFRKI